ncbi:carboxymuconolactone decarboxylase family protein [Mycobacteroides salmoniphilum]|uniref:Carboxymuconolactone decarboxylase family protein n=1 Tax=Mycobacteroides salmoniphilum TaxID=404941 RepID=A0A4R8SEG4_9MYCO|nr:carboxymuconolactone decarboxylase family protein [Mycobacteroides salmoniphilum]TDZ94561.1 Carboxymuconolactone decarboxylase family protein [Mycobacteroides salmoniphilum]TEA00893.1 Carboxymuconolactone decarboxylase family protein [Mycobacteroides salmoniphilum]
MARIPYLPDDGAFAVNFSRILRYSPEIGGLVSQQGGKQLSVGSLDPVIRELVILNSGINYDSPYEWDQHEAIAKAVGVTDQQLEALKAQDRTAAAFTAEQSALLQFADQVAKKPRADDKSFDTAKQLLTTQQLVELVILVGYYFLVARITTTFDLELDAPSGDTLLKEMQEQYKR